MSGTMSRAFDYDDQSPEDRLKDEIDNSEDGVIDVDPDDVTVDDTEDPPAATGGESSPGPGF